jgi:2,3-bisphosphoglycerate-dependent phosphoglycerate mutase
MVPPPPPPRFPKSLADCQRRALACFEDTIAPALFDARPDLPHPLPEEGSRAVFLVAHSNTIRALMASFDNVPSELIPNLHVPNSVPILYRCTLYDITV